MTGLLKPLLLTNEDRAFIAGIRQFLHESRDWTNPGSRDMNPDRFQEEIRRNRLVKGWIQTGNIWMDGKLTVRDPYG